MDLSAALNEEEKAPEVLPPAATPTLSLVAVKPQFTQYIKRVDAMVSDAKAIDITDEERLKFAVALGGEAKKIAKLIEAKEKEVTAEASDYVKSVRSFCQMFLDRLVANTKKTNTDSIEITLKKKITDYQTKVELERRKAEEAARKAAAELQAKLDAEAAEANRKAREEAARKAEEEARKQKASEAEIEAARKAAEEEAKKHEVVAPTVTAPVIPVSEKVTRTETGTSAHQAKRWVCTVINPDAVPREYCEPSTKRLNDAVKMGVREITGCKIEEVTETRFRT